MPKLALLFHLADQATEQRGDQSISVEYAKQASDYCYYLESHARRVYASIVTPEMRAARDFAQKIRTGQVPLKDGCFAGRTVYLKGWSGLDTADWVRGAAEVLTDAGWLRPAPKLLGPGRPMDRYLVNPKVLP